MARRTCAQRIQIPLDGDPNLCLYSKSGLLLAKGFLRVVIGGRGPYVEFSDDQIVKDNISVPRHAEHKLESSLSYYWEYRSNDDSFAKLYFQKMEVQYADYKVGRWYIAPSELTADELGEIWLPLHSDPPEPIDPEPPKKPNGTLFDF